MLLEQRSLNCVGKSVVVVDVIAIALLSFDVLPIFFGGSASTRKVQFKLRCLE